MSKAMKKHFVTFYSPGSFVAEATTKPVDAWSVDLAVKMADDISERYGATPYGFRLSTRGRGPDDLDSRELRRSRHFLDGQACRRPWRWALIGPSEYLLKGTRYKIARHPDAEIPNVSYSHGYWGGDVIGSAFYPIFAAKFQVEMQATSDCASATVP